MTNPFDLPGPQFLAFYAVLGALVVAVYRYWIIRLELRGGPADIRDPYQIAFLRGGPTEVLRLVLVSLIERGLLKQVDATHVETAGAHATRAARRPIEQYVLDTCGTSMRVSRLFTGSHLAEFTRRCEECRFSLESARCLSGGQGLLARLPAAFFALGVLAWVALHKIQLALARGHHNIGFLIALAVFFALAIGVISIKRRTAAGDAALRSLKHQFVHLRGSTPSRTDDSFQTTMLMSVYGMDALPTVDYPYVHTLFQPEQQAASTTSSHGGSGCAGATGLISSDSGSSWSSGSSDSSASSGCGGGGGGGCGGCGG